MAEYSPQDWENIPAIIPSSFAHLARQVGSIQDWVKVKESEESIASICFKIQNLEKLLRANTEQTSDQIKDMVGTVEKKLKIVKQDVEKLKEKPKIQEAVMQTEITSKDFEQNPDIVISEHSEDEDEIFTENDENKSKNEAPKSLLSKLTFGEEKKLEKVETDMKKPRMYSLDLIKKLIYKYLNRSILKIRVGRQEKIVKELNDNQEEIYEKIDTTVHDFGLEIQRAYEKIDFYKDSLDKICREVEEKLLYINRWSVKVEEKFSEYQKGQDELKIKNQELLEDYDVIKQFNKKIEEKLTESVKDLKSHTKKKIEALGKTLRKENTKIAEIIDEKLKEITTKIDQDRVEVTGEFSIKINEIVEKHSIELKEATAEIEQQIFDYKKIQESDLEKFIESFTDEKTENHENFRRIHLEIKKMRTDFDRWVANVMEPAHVSEARIFAIEARVKEEEMARLENLHFVNDIIKKLIFSFEQAQMNVLAPALRPPSRNDSDANVSLLMKRLAFLKKVIQFNGEPSTQSNSKPTLPSRKPGTGKDRLSFSAMDDTSFITDKAPPRGSYTSSPMRMSTS
ncbi:unnamed protein product [Blepharisma stoltei]|uniref:Uncharacterized protein n=1 Tax=Blepharisma stoltei TaxID=1481888 RepID=A0AAU9J224_9CILI|nr:unnamed protein product [Blepharisma stoltei]